MGGTKNVVQAALDPVGFATSFTTSKATGNDVKIDPLSVAKDQAYDKPKEMKKEIEDEIRRQEEEARLAEEAYQKEKTEEKKRLRDQALKNLERSQARLRSPGSSRAGGYSGTILTSPLGITGGTNNGTTQKTLLGQ